MPENPTEGAEGWGAETPERIEAEPKVLRSDTLSATILATPEEVFDYMADIRNWPEFTDFAESVRKGDGDSWIIYSPQGPVLLEPDFERDRGLLDSTVTLPSGEQVFIPYRVVPNGEGAELVMTNFQASGDSDEAYAEQLDWMKKELENVKRIVEERRQGTPAI